LTPLEDLHLVQAVSGHHGGDVYEVVPGSAEEVEMGLLAGDERASSREGFGNGYADGLEGLEEEEGEGEGEDDGVVRAGGDGDGDGGTGTATKVPLTREDKKAMALLIVLCASSSSISVGGSPPPTSSVTFSLIFSPSNAALGPRVCVCW
jgi:hypothetical protein